MQTPVKFTWKCHIKLDVNKYLIPEHKYTSPMEGFFFIIWSSLTSLSITIPGYRDSLSLSVLVFSGIIKFIKI